MQRPRTSPANGVRSSWVAPGLPRRKPRSDTRSGALLAVRCPSPRRLAEGGARSLHAVARHLSLELDLVGLVRVGEGYLVALQPARDGDNGVRPAYQGARDGLADLFQPE